MLEIGYNHPFEIRKYAYPCEKSPGTTILYLSDFHYNRFGKSLAENISAEIDRLNPDIILLGGDYTDSKKGLPHFQRMMSSISRRKNIFAIPGNHDSRRIRQTREIIEAGNGIWLQNRSATITSAGVTIRIDGGRPNPSSIPPDLSILLLHRPIDVTNIAHHYHIIFAGHLHGSQAVFWTRGKDLYPGRLVYTWNRLSATVGDCQYLISKGLGDSLPIRFNCRKDAILVQMVSTATLPAKHIL